MASDTATTAVKKNSANVSMLTSWAEFLKLSSAFLLEFERAIFQITEEDTILIRTPGISEIERIDKITTDLKVISSSELLEETQENTRRYLELFEIYESNKQFAFDPEFILPLGLLVHDLLIQVNTALGMSNSELSKSERKQRDELRKTQRELQQFEIGLRGVAQAYRGSDVTSSPNDRGVREQVQASTDQFSRFRTQALRQIGALDPVAYDDYERIFQREIQRTPAFRDILKEIYQTHAEAHDWDALLSSPSASRNPSTSIKSSSTVVKTWSQILKENPTLSSSLQNYAKAVAFVRVDSSNAQSIARMVANKLAQGPNGYFDIQQSLLRNPSFLREFQQALFQEVAIHRSEFLSYTQGNELYLLSDASDNQLSEFLESNASISNKLGPRALDILYATNKTENLEKIRALEEKGSERTEDEELLLQQHRYVQQTLEIYEREEKTVSKIPKSIAGILPTYRPETTINFTSQSAGEVLLDPVGLHEGEEEITAQSYAERIQSIIEQQNSMGDEIFADDGNYQTQTDVESPASESGSTSEDSAVQRKPLSPAKLQQAQAKIKRLQQFGKVASKLATNPVALGAMGAGAGAVGILAGLATQAPALVGAGGAVLGGSIGATIGFFAGGLPGALLGGAIGSSLGGGTGYFGAQAMFANSGLPGTGSGTSQVLQSAQASAAKMAPGVSQAAGGIIPGATPTAASLLQGAGSAALNTLGAIPGATSSLLTGATSLTPSIPIAGIISGITVAGTVGTLLIVSSQTGTFLIDSGNLAQSNPYFTIVKQPSPKFSEDPTVVEYTIRIAPRDGYAGLITITNASDVMTFRTAATEPLAPKNAPPEEISKLTGLLTEEKSITYTIDFDASYDDTLVTNTLTLNYDVQDEVSGQQFSANANVTFGQPPNIACWPATGTITQGPYAQFSHKVVDAIDIFNSDNPSTEVISPFSGRASFFNSSFSSVKSACYGNHVILQTAEGYQLVFAHMSGFASEFEAGRSFDIVAGTPIGRMGMTGSGLAGCPAFNEHLHYELAGGTPPTSILETLLPEPLERNPGNTEFGVTGNQYVNTNTCRTNDPSPTREAQDEIACLKFVRGDQDWNIPEELRRSDGNGYIDQMQRLLSSEKVSSILCPADGSDITIARYKGTGATEGCNFDGTGFGGAEWVRAGSELAVCNLLFTQQNTMGTSTMWHEMGHLFQLRNTNWTSFPDFGSLAEGYLKTYPLQKTKVEDFAESFGACLKNSVTTTTTTPISFRGQSLALSEYQQHCSQIQRILDEVNVAN